MQLISLLCYNKKKTFKSNNIKKKTRKSSFWWNRIPSYLQIFCSKEATIIVSPQLRGLTFLILKQPSNIIRVWKHFQNYLKLDINRTVFQTVLQQLPYKVCKVTVFKNTIPCSPLPHGTVPIDSWGCYVSFFILRFCLSMFSVARSTEVVMESRASSCLSSSASVSKARLFSFCSICWEKRPRALSERPASYLRSVIDKRQLVISLL